MADFRFERGDFSPERVDFRSERADSTPERADIRPGGQVLDLRAYFRLEKEISGLRGLRGGQTNKRTDGQANVSRPVYN